MKHLLNTYKIFIFIIKFFKIQNKPNKNSNNSKKNSTENYHLHFVFEIMRHGARAPMDLTSSSSSSEDELDFFHEKWSDGAGELTSIGIRQHFLIGYRNRLKYIDQSLSQSVAGCFLLRFLFALSCAFADDPSVHL